MNFLKYSFAALTVAMASFVACSTGEGDDELNISGTVTDTGNTLAFISGKVLRSNGKVASGATVRMATVVDAKDAMHVPEYVETQTDSTGAFTFDTSKALGDTFQLAVIDTNTAEISYLPQTTAESGEFDSIKLEKAAIFSSVLYYEELTEPPVAVGSHFRVFLPGTPFFQSVFAGDSFSMMIPAGYWQFSFSPGDPQIVSKLEESAFADSLIFRNWSMEDTLKAGDTLVAGPFIWSSKVKVDSIIEEEKKEQEIVSRISGRVYCKSGKECAGVEVQVITDIYGFGVVFGDTTVSGDTTVFVAQTVTDSTGRWYMPVPEVPYDSFRVEYRRVSRDSKITEGGFSRYVRESEVRNLGDTLFLGNDSLVNLSGLNSGVRLTIDKQDTASTDNCMAISVVVGIKGSAHFVRAVTCNMLKILDLPSGAQDVVLYTGDAKVLDALQTSKTPLKQYITITHVELPAGEPLDQQWMTFTPPTLK